METPKVLVATKYGPVLIVCNGINHLYVDASTNCAMRGKAGRHG